MPTASPAPAPIPVDVLAAVGGLEIALLAGVILGGERPAGPRGSSTGSSRARRR